jgi:uncharacterized membrane protein YfhO
MILLTLSVLFFIPFWATKTIPYSGDFTGSDLTELNLPLRFMAASAWQAGQVPLQSNLLAAGFPLLAEGQAGVFYPLNFLYIFLPFWLAINISLLLNFFLAALFSHWYFRSLKVSQAGSLFAAIAFSFGGFFIFRLKHLNLINAAIWLPLLFYLIEKYFTAKKKYLVVACWPLVLAVQFFAGHPQITYVTAISAMVYFGLRLWQEEGNNIKSVILKFGLIWLAVGILALGLSAIQLLPTLVNSLDSGRSISLDYSQIVRLAYPVASLAFFVSPYIYGNPAENSFVNNFQAFGVFWENNIYFGLLPLILALVAILFLFAKNKLVRILTVFSLCCWLVVFQDLSPVFIILWKTFPGFEMFRFHQRFLLPILLVLTALAGLGFDYFWQELRRIKPRFRILAKSKMFFSWLLPLLLILVLLVDLYVMATHYLGMADMDSYFNQPETVNFLKTDQTNFRIYSIGWPQAWQSVNELAGGWNNNLALQTEWRQIVPPNSNVFWGIASAQDRASLEGGMLDRYSHFLQNQILLQTNQESATTSLEINSSTLNLMTLYNVKYLLAFKELSNSNLVLTDRISNTLVPSVKVYQNTKQLGLAYGVFKVIEATSTAEMLNLVLDDDFDPTEEIVLVDLPVSKNNEEDQATSTVNIINQNNAAYALTVDFSADGYLFISQIFDNGWQAKVDGRAVSLLRANFAFMALPLASGYHEIELTYWPKEFSWGLILSLVSLVALIGWIAIYLLLVEKKHD